MRVRVLTPLLASKMRIHDTCGVNNLHGMPGIAASILAAVVVAVACCFSRGFLEDQIFALYWICAGDLALELRIMNHHRN